VKAIKAYKNIALRIDFCLRYRNNDTACDLDFW